MVAWRYATWWLALIVATVAAEARAGLDQQRVAIAETEVMIEPSDSAYSTGALRRGDRVQVLARRGEWATIKPPSDSFDWINSAQIRETADASCSVKTSRAQVRHGSGAAQIPGPPARTLDRGAIVHLLDLPVLHVRSGATLQSWRAIEPEAAAVRYVRLDAIEAEEVDERPARVGPGPIDHPERVVGYQPEPVEADLPPEVNAELASIAAMNRSVKSGPLETWNLEPIRGRYEALLRQFGTDARVKAAITPLLDRSQQNDELAKKAQLLDRIFREGDQRDSKIHEIQRSVDLARAHTDRKYDAQGLLQPSSRRHQGQKVLALIGPEGKPISYLQVPPGVPLSRFLARKVGVRGIVHFDEGLGARLISVRDMDLIEKAR